MAKVFRTSLNNFPGCIVVCGNIYADSLPKFPQVVLNCKIIDRYLAISTHIAGNLKSIYKFFIRSGEIRSPLIYILTPFLW